MRSDQARPRVPAVPAAVPRPLLVAPIGGVSAAVLSRLLADRLSREVAARRVGMLVEEQLPDTAAARRALVAHQYRLGARR